MVLNLIIEKSAKSISKNKISSKEQIRKTLKILKKIEQYFRLSISQPNEIENIHKLRVYIRNFFVNVKYLSPYYPKYKRKIILSGLNVLKDCTDRIRDVDVFQDYIQKIFDIKQENNLSKNGIDALYSDLTVMREQSFHELQRIFFDFISYDFFKYWRTILKSPRKDSDKRTDKFQSLLSNKLKESWYEFESRIQTSTDDEEALHSLRIAGKKFRYSFDSLKDFFSHDVQNEINRIMVDVQDSLGTINDCKTILFMLDEKKKVQNQNPMVITTISHRYFFRLIQEKKKFFQTQRNMWLSSKTIENIALAIYNF